MHWLTPVFARGQEKTVHVIIPAAGYGTRLRPQTWSKPKPLVSVAGKPILGHVLDSVVTLDPESVVFITGYLGGQIEDYVNANYDFPAEFVTQKEMRGQADAISLARSYVEGPVLIVFADTIFSTDLTRLNDSDADGVIYVKEVEDPQSFGIVEMRDNYLHRIVEKPANPPTNLAVTGIYYFRDSARLFAAIDAIMDAEMQTKGEYYLTDAIQVMIDDGARIEAAEMDLWLDCGRPETLLETNRILLERMDSGVRAAEILGSVIVSPVVIDPSAHIENAVIGPYVSIGKNVHITNAILRNVIVNHESEVRDVMLTDSIVGDGAIVTGGFNRINVGDNSEVNLGSQSLGKGRGV